MMQNVYRFKALKDMGRKVEGGKNLQLVLGGLSVVKRGNATVSAEKREKYAKDSGKSFTIGQPLEGRE